MNDEIDIDDLDGEKFEKLDEDTQDDIKSELTERFLDDPDDALAQAEELGIDQEELFDNL